jgi:ABC-2 type transport system ATP-binding protein
VGTGATVAVDVSKRYGRARPWVLDGVDLRLEPGTLTVVVGANGSGKSTLLRVLAGVARPTRGRVTARPARVGYVPERLPARIRMTSRGYLAHMARLHGLDDDDVRPRAEALARALALQPGLDVPMATLSKGNRQKVCLAQALMAPVGLLLLDEPWNGLDPAAGEALGRELAVARQGGAAVIATAHRTGAVPGADRTFVISGGHLDAGTAGGGGGHGPPTAVVVELSPPNGGTLEELPAWAGVVRARLCGPLWQLEVRADGVDGLLADALATGWSVHRVEPAPTETEWTGS